MAAEGAVTDFMALLKRPLFTVSGMTLSVGLALIIGVLVYIAFFKR